ncbi:hypothetical protein TW84_19745 [Vibrio neptunius]|uniref:hypothetical protein n=1 Tax=Vibrio neptunius TaxID=170651 RepID=UPI0005F9BCF0|nr:hypothetical protein [Vibrio neptunius]KJY86428.1 hypothetical protein TW84_19745 [Vibrio neptunius]
MSRKLIILVGGVSVVFVYIAFFIATMFASMTFKNWVSLGSSVDDSDIATVQNIMNTLVNIPIVVFSLHVILITFMYWYSRSRKSSSE